MMNRFAALSRKVSDAAGSPYAFVGAAAIILVWALSGFIVGFSDTWQLIINTGTTIVTFLMVFLIQSSQNKDTQALHLKLDDLLCSIDKANDSLIDIEHGTDQDLAAAREKVTASSDAGVGAGSRSPGSKT